GAGPGGVPQSDRLLRGELTEPPRVNPSMPSLAGGGSRERERGPLGLGAEPRPPQRISNPASPSGSSVVSSTEETSAPRGPREHQSTIEDTASASPSKTASTALPLLLLPQPATPRELASLRQESRKKTPWTLPWTTTLRRARSLIESLAHLGEPQAPD